jgi:excisionase family DNA binding protein
MASDEQWVGVDEVARHLRVGKDSVYRWIDARGLPAHRVGRLLRFKLSEVDAWVRTGGGEEAGAAESGGKSGDRSGNKRRPR